MGLSKMDSEVSSLKTSVGAVEEKQLSISSDISQCSQNAEAAMAAAKAANDAATAATAAAAAAALTKGTDDEKVVSTLTVSLDDVRTIAKEEVPRRIE